MFAGQDDLPPYPFFTFREHPLRTSKNRLAAVAVTGFTAVTVLAGTGQAAAATAPQYQVTLGPNLANSYLAINSRGDILGEGVQVGRSTEEGFVIKAGTSTMSFLEGPGDPTNSVTTNVAEGINNNGQVVGWRFPTNQIVGNQLDEADRPLEWQGGGSQGVDLGVDRAFTATNVQANAINDNGLVVGHVDLSGTKPWQLQNGAKTDLPTLSGGDAEPFAVNNNGVIVGDADDNAGNTVAVQWHNGQIVTLGALPGGGFAAAGAVNAFGVAVGASTVTGGNFGNRHAVMFANGKVTDLNVPGTQVNDAIANGINDSGVIVGVDGFGNAFIYRNGQSTDLNTLIPASAGIHLTSAKGINDNGVIIAQGVLTAGSRNGAHVVVELTPATS